MGNIISSSISSNVNAGDAEKRNRAVLERPDFIRPPSWSDSTKILVPLSPLDDAYWDVARALQESMADAHIAQVWRVQNAALWTDYLFQKQRLSRNGANANETWVWHGTSKINPCVIYNDTQDGFMMQYANSGLWGRGLYFAQKSVYSHDYAFCPSERPQSSILTDGRPKGNEDERELFLSKLLVGNAIEMNSDKNLTVPPNIPNTTGLKYNTVTGHADGSKIWIVYENGRSFPEYLVRYYRSQQRDLHRTRYGTKEEARRLHNPNTSAAGVENGNGRTIVWEYMDADNTWRAYASEPTVVGKRPSTIPREYYW